MVGGMLTILMLEGISGGSSTPAMKGRVVDMNGDPVVDAQVSILGRSGSVRTDRAGHFTWTPDPSPPFEVLVVLPNGQYMAPVLIKEMPDSEAVEVRVLPIANDRITVAGATPNIDVTSASGLTILDRQGLENRRADQLVTALQDIPGLSRISDGTAAVPAIRGLARGRTLLMIDGGRVTTERRAGPSATYLDPFFLEGIEVARGPGSVAYGSDAIGGVIHARTRRPEFSSPIHMRFKGTLGAGVPMGGAALELSRGWDRSSFLFQGSFRQLNDYNSPQGKIDNSGARFSSLLGRGAFEVGSGLLSVGMQSDHSRDMGRPRNNSDEQRFSYPREDSERFTASYELDSFSGFSVARFDFFLGSYRLVTRRDTIPTETEPRSVNDADVDANDVGFRTLLVRPLKQARWQVGVDINGRYGLQALDHVLQYDKDDNLVSSVVEESIRDARSTDASAYTSLELLLTKIVTASGGIRLSHVTSSSEGGTFGTRSTSDNALAGFGSVTVDPWTDLSLVGQVARGFRQPTLSDRYFQGITARGVITGNPSLEPESSLQFDFAARYTKRRVHLGAYAFSYRIDDLIERYEEGDGEFFFRNQGQARLYGFELEMHLDLGRGMSLQLGAQSARGESRETGEALDDVPADSLSLQWRKALLEQGYVQIRSAAFARDERPGPTETDFPGYGILDLGGGWDFGPKINLDFQLRNLLDKDYPLSPDRRAVASPGRSAVLTLTVSPFAP